jgi:hypothetical protein
MDGEGARHSRKEEEGWQEAGTRACVSHDKGFGFYPEGTREPLKVFK